MRHGFLGTVFITFLSGIVLFSAHINIQRTDALESADYTRLVLSELNFQSIRIRQGFFKTLTYAEDYNLSGAVSSWYLSLISNQGPVKLKSLRIGRVPFTSETLLCLQLDYLTQDPGGICGSFTMGEHDLGNATCTRADKEYPLLDSLMRYSGDQITYSGILPVREREGCGVSNESDDEYMIFGELIFLDNATVSAVGILPGESIQFPAPLERLGTW